MKTDDLLTLLATGVTPVKSGETRRRHALAIGWGGFGAMGLLLLFLGVREDLALAVHWPMFWLKLAFPLAMAGAALLAATRLARPGVALGRAWLMLATPLAIVWAVAAGALLGSPPEERVALLLGQTWWLCPLLIAFLSVPAFIAGLWAMKGLAPTRPALAGAAAGLLAGALAAAVYALHCQEMAAPFLATWYLAGMLVPTLIGGVVGARLLRW